MWIIGGGTYWTEKEPQPKYFNDVWSSADGVNWDLHCEHAQWRQRAMHDVAVFDGKIWIMEGCNPDSPNATSIAANTTATQPQMAHWISTLNLNDVWYSENGSNWHELPNSPWAPRHASGLVAHDDALWLIAGNNMQSDVWKLVKKYASGK
jgi:hypothetical protein